MESPHPAGESAVSTSSGDSRIGSSEREIWLAAAAWVILVTELALVRLRTFPYPLDWQGAWDAALSILPHTGWVALKVWSFWALAWGIAIAVLVKTDPSLELGDALIGGASAVWIFGYVLGEVLGPIRLFRGPTLWVLAAIGAVWVWRNPPRLKFVAPTAGQKLALVAFGLLAVGMVPLQLASPVNPYMDVLAYPAAVQRIMSFGVYLPLDNNPYGLFGNSAAGPGLELFYAMLGMGSHTKLAVMTMTAAMLPTTALLVFGTYRLGRVSLGDLAGGAAPLLMFFSCLPRRMQGMRGTALAFVLVVIGLSFFVESRRNSIFAILGALSLGTAVAVHALIGGMGMMVASAATLLWLAESDLTGFALGVTCLAGATLVALPAVAVNVERPAPYPVLPLLQLGGVAVIVAAAIKLRPSPSPSRNAARRINLSLVVLLIAAILYRHAIAPGSVYEDVFVASPALIILAFSGLVALIAAWLSESGVASGAGVVVATLWLPFLGQYVLDRLYSLNLETLSFGLREVSAELSTYWLPYFLVFPAAAVFAYLYERWSKPLTVCLLLTLVIYPWRQAPEPLDYDSNQHSITEYWGFTLTQAGRGFWQGTPDNHWLFGPDQFALKSVLDREIRDGRITAATHIFHVTDNIGLTSMIPISVFTGINDDPYSEEFNPADQFHWGSRVRPIADLPRALAAKPPYVFEQIEPPPQMHLSLGDYEEIFHRDQMRLFRRKNLGRK